MVFSYLLTQHPPPKNQIIQVDVPNSSEQKAFITISILIHATHNKELKAFLNLIKFSLSSRRLKNASACYRNTPFISRNIKIICNAFEIQISHSILWAAEQKNINFVNHTAYKKAF